MPSLKKAIIFDTSDGQQLRINMISPWLRKYFREKEETDKVDSRTLKVVKLSLDGGFTCPNRDGSKGFGGCLFCSESGSGDMASSTADNIREALRHQMKLLSDKWPPDKYNLKYIAYFQSHTNTYAPAEKLRRLFEAALEVDGVCGLAIATRSDCISDEVLRLLDEINRRTFLWVELGLQTIHRSTAKAMNLCHTVEDYDSAVTMLLGKNIRVVTHLIFGLPGENRKMMLESVRHVCNPIDVVISEAARIEGSAEESGMKSARKERKDFRRIFGIKIHMLNVVKGSGMEEKFSDYIPFEIMEDYVDILIEALEMIPPEITMHRISGDAPRATLIAPKWSYQKRTILNMIHRTMREKNTWQGRRAEQ